MENDRKLYTLLAADRQTRARNGILSLPHGDVPTPAFMPVGTNGTVKAIFHRELDQMGIRLILGNTYHLYLRPGTEVIGEIGGLHAFSSWPHNILTDSGGYQVFSLAPFRKIEQDGVFFRSHIDGSPHRLTPEKVVDIQQTLGSDILMPLDVCTAPGITYREALSALRTTTEWAGRSRDRWLQRDPSFRGSLFGIIQGNFFPDLRARSAEEILALDLPGTAIGGLSVGEDYDTFREYLALTSELLPADRPRYLMGIGTPEYILDAVSCGIDIFDCVFPTRTARNGMVFTRSGPIALKKQYHARTFRPIEETCGCFACRTYTRAYLRHLFKAKEMLGPMLATIHNLFFIEHLMTDIRAAISEGRFASFRDGFLSAYRKTGDSE